MFSGGGYRSRTLVKNKLINTKVNRTFKKVEHIPSTEFSFIYVLYLLSYEQKIKTLTINYKLNLTLTRTLSADSAFIFRLIFRKMKNIQKVRENIQKVAYAEGGFS